MIGRDRLDEMHEHLRPFDMPQELVSQSDASVSTLDQAGNVRQHKLSVVADADDAEIRVLRRERVIGDLRRRASQPAEQRRFAGVRFADQTNISDEFQFEHHRARFAQVAAFELARCAVCGGREVLVAATSASPFGRQESSVMMIEIEKDFAGRIFDERSWRDTNLDVGSIVAGLQRALPVHAAIRLPALASDEMRQTTDVLVRDDDDVTAVPSLAAVRPAERNIGLATKAHASVTSVARFAFNGVAIHKHGGGTVTLPTHSGERLGCRDTTGGADLCEDTRHVRDVWPMFVSVSIVAHRALAHFSERVRSQSVAHSKLAWYTERNFARLANFSGCGKRRVGPATCFLHTSRQVIFQNP